MRLVTFERHPRSQWSHPDDRRDHSDSVGDAAVGFETPEAGRPGTRRLGALLHAGPSEGDVVDLNRALAMKLAFDDVGAPEAEADSLLPADMCLFLRRGQRALEAAHEALDYTLHALQRYDAPDLARAGVLERRRGVRICAPIARPGKIIGVARNYADHAAERGREVPAQPTLFLKAPSSVIGPEDEIVLPRASQAVDFEGELAVVIGTRARNLESGEALDAVAGYTTANDVTARDLQDAGGQRFTAKSCDTFAPLGPTLVTADEISDPQDLGIQTQVSGEILQSARTKEMIFPVAHIIAFASTLMTLEPGDVILTGTPAGVGASRTPPRWLREGDVVEVAVESVGRLRNYVREERD